jgi:dynein-related subfamily AAA family protein
MKPSEVEAALITCIEANRPPCLWGSPGIGKSKIMAQVAAATSRRLIDVRAVLLDPVDLRGLPHVNGDNRAHWCTPDFLPRDGRGILFFDEFNRAPQLVQNACLQLVLDRALGEYQLPEGWVTAGACNPDGGGVNKLSAAMNARFIHLDVETDLGDWCKWAIGAGIEPAVIAFLRFRPELLSQYDRAARAFPNPRSWEFISQITAKQPNRAVELALFEGTIGHGAAIEYAAFLQLFRSIPSIDSILLSPDKAPVPLREPASLWAIGAALARRATDQNFRRVLTYLERMPPEYAVMTVRDATVRDATLATTPEFTQWAIQHADVVI